MLPANLQRVLNEAYTQMENHPEHQLLPGYRQKMYNLLGTSARAQVDILTTKLVMVFWNQSVTGIEKNLIDIILDSAEKVLQGKLSTDEGRSKAQEIADRIEGFQDITSSARWAAAAAIEALYSATGYDRWENINFSEEETNETLDPWTSDAALWASLIYTAARGNDHYAKNKEFWTSWLKDIVPQAWELGA